MGSVTYIIGNRFPQRKLLQDIIATSKGTVDVKGAFLGKLRKAWSGECTGSRRTLAWIYGKVVARIEERFLPVT